MRSYSYYYVICMLRVKLESEPLKAKDFVLEETEFSVVDRDIIVIKH